MKPAAGAVVWLQQLLMHALINISMVQLFGMFDAAAGLCIVLQVIILPAADLKVQSLLSGAVARLHASESA
jgi:hypothetical protein